MNNEKTIESKENILGFEKIGKLIRKFAIPAIIAMLVNSLYNIVDQIFIGWGVGYLGNGATNIVFPLTMIALAFSLMFGDGASAFLSLKLGEKNKDEAAKGIGAGILLSVVVSLVYTFVVLIFLPQLLNFFGCTDELRDYATSYGRISAIGFPFMMLGVTLNSMIRADGSPKYSMTTMLLGAVLNTCLDPVLIFIFKMGVDGAAIATVAAQILTFLLNVIYLKKFKSIKISVGIFRCKFAILKKVSILGISSFITQMAIVFVMATENNMLGKYGAESEFGANIPITVLGIVMKIGQILNSIIIGLAAGSQPIIGYNYGAKNYGRVKKTLKIVLITSVMISTIAFILFQCIPDKLIMIFGSQSDPKYVEFAIIAFRIYLMLCIVNGVQIPAGIFFQAIGKSAKSAIVSLSRQILILIPAMIILGHFFGIHGLLYSGPLADGVAFLIALTFLIIEFKKLNDDKVIVKHFNEEDSHEKNHKDSKKNIVITIAREYGSGGRYIGKLVAEKLGIKLYDKEFITKIAKETGLSNEYIENNEQKRSGVSILDGYYSTLSNNDELFIKESEMIKDIATKESCVIIGRCANFILKEKAIKVFIYNSEEDKINRVVKYYNISKNDAKKEIDKINKLRENHYKYYTESNWKDANNYDIMINSDVIGIERAAKLICNLIENK